MDPHETIADHVAADADTDSAVYLPSLQLTEGQPPPIAANGGLSFMSFDRDGDGGTAAAIEAVLGQIAEGHVQAFIDRIESRHRLGDGPLARRIQRPWRSRPMRGLRPRKFVTHRTSSSPAARARNRLRTSCKHFVEAHFPSD